MQVGMPESVWGAQEGNEDQTEGVEGSQRLVWMAKRSVRVLPLPVLAAENGHSAFVQELHLRSGLATTCGCG